MKFPVPLQRAHLSSKLTPINTHLVINNMSLEVILLLIVKSLCQEILMSALTTMRTKLSPKLSSAQIVLADMTSHSDSSELSQRPQFNPGYFYEIFWDHLNQPILAAAMLRPPIHSPTQHPFMVYSVCFIGTETHPILLSTVLEGAT